MCGIGGWIGVQPDKEWLASRMIKKLHHRGPDGYGVKHWKVATLLHTRLSIIDLSAAGAQPIANEDGTVWTVFNGEIYNHRELRHNLKIRGHKFKGRSDSEILPHLYEEEGSAFVEKLRGMFSLAIFDTRRKTLLLARDRFGIKPLFYAPDSQRLAFASEIRALLTLPSINTQPDKQAVYDFSALFYIPAPETFYTGIRALEPGVILKAHVDADEVSWKTSRYHLWKMAPNHELTLAQAVDRADVLITSAVTRQMESDVPLGSLLSGGIDSSLVSSAAQAVSGKLQTFNVHFSDKVFDETWAAVAVAEHIGSDHKTLEMDDCPGSWSHITELLLHTGQPFADASLFAMNAVCKLMRRHVTVALSGDGGDEGFGGYDLYWQIQRIARLQMLPPFIWQAGSFLFPPLAKLGLIPQHLPQRLNSLSIADEVGSIQGLFSWMQEEELMRLCGDKKEYLPVRRLFEPQWEHRLPASSSRLERLSAYATEANVRLTLSNDFLFKVDAASMRESLEVRVPMLDEELFSFGLSLPHHLKVAGRECKRTLRMLAERKLPLAIAKKPKWGFGVPLNEWFDEDFKIRLHDELLGTTSRLPDFFEIPGYRPMIEAFRNDQPYFGLSRGALGIRMLALLSIHLFATATAGVSDS